MHRRRGTPRRGPGTVLLPARSMTPVHVRRRRNAAMVVGGGLVGLGGLIALVALVAAASGDGAERAPASPRPAAATSSAQPPPDPLTPRSIRSTGTLAAVPATNTSSAGDTAGLGFAVEVEKGVAVDRAAFAREVERTLLDRRGWTADGAYSLRRTDEDEAAFTVTLASPDTTDELCAPLATNGTYSCHQNGRAVLNAERWTSGAEAYGRDLARYRQYMVNHEVGHALGESHLECPGEGLPAPIMVQQTKGVAPCEPNPWPLDSER
ncbi:MAG: hypothetical protein AVDCRST_MAG17-492 [uncultured Solirubrobacterales bacterium]|uniref:DUF3152 domain-containing protein n=1 Tax=uncultured Solirubrobacterales bacterium TaxID=768556 RepID=A0A6J4S0Z9_9ACTN|nr:MAG: hypothetical protein AVDCRST_MAG17-492 [uncultured Solirubrobacterales bacterium]